MLAALIQCIDDSVVAYFLGHPVQPTMNELVVLNTTNESELRLSYDIDIEQRAQP